MSKEDNKEVDIEELKLKLNPRQRKFCELYASDKEFFGHGTDSYSEAYDRPLNSKRDYNIVSTNASNLLKKPNILLYINYLLENDGLNDTFVDKQLLFLIKQNADFKSKLGSIREYNKLKSRIQNRLDLTSGGKPIEGNQIVFKKFGSEDLPSS